MFGRARPAMTNWAPVRSRTAIARNLAGMDL